MRLAEFILQELEPIIKKWETFAATMMPAAADMDSFALRDHAEQILRAIAKDMETYQTREAQMTKSLGQKPALVANPITTRPAELGPAGFRRCNWLGERSEIGVRVERLSSDQRRDEGKA